VLLVRVGRGRHNSAGPTTIVRASGYLVDPDWDPSNPAGLSTLSGGLAGGFGMDTIAPGGPLDGLVGSGRGGLPTLDPGSAGAPGGPLDGLVGSGRGGLPTLDPGSASLGNGSATFGGRPSSFVGGPSDDGASLFGANAGGLAGAGGAGLAGGSAALAGDASAAGLTIPLLPGEHTPARRLAFLAVNACTLASLSLGVFAIFLAMQADVRAAAACLIACVAFDGLDGALARRLGVASPFGAQMDSLADMCSFGLAAPVVVYASLASTVSTPAAGATCALVAACAAIRLARFNVSPKDGRFFCGVPTTMAAAVLALSVLINLPVAGRFQLAGVALLAFAMVSSFPYAKLARLAKLPPWLWLVPLSGALVDLRLTFLSLVIAYLASGPLLWLHQRRTP
jgi:CDP-diacylglycerol--serine O-phosphatidyltransferase